MRHSLKRYAMPKTSMSTILAIRQRSVEPQETRPREQKGSIVGREPLNPFIACLGRQHSVGAVQRCVRAVMAVVVEHDTRREGLAGVIERTGVKDARLVHVIPEPVHSCLDERLNAFFTSAVSTTKGKKPSMTLPEIESVWGKLRPLNRGQQHLDAPGVLYRRGDPRLSGLPAGRRYKPGIPDKLERLDLAVGLV